MRIRGRYYQDPSDDPNYGLQGCERCGEQEAVYYDYKLWLCEECLDAVEAEITEEEDANHR